MKRILATLLLMVLLCGCTGGQNTMDKAMALRAKILASSAEFDAKITADYTDRIYTFQMQCRLDTSGNVTFTVTQPEAIAGVTGNISAAGGKLTFGEEILAFPLLAEGQVSPVSAPWLLMKTLRSGFITSAGTVDGYTRLIVDDSFDSDPFTLHIFLDEANSPTEAEIYWHNRRILTLSICNFQML